MAAKAAPRRLDERQLSAEELAVRWDMSPRTLRDWRWKRKGPRFIRIGRKPFYPESEVALYEANRPLQG